MRLLPNSIRKRLAYLYYEKGWRHPLNQFLVYAKGAFAKPKNRKVTFILFAQGRTGSTVLTDLIKKSSQIHCDGEIFGAFMPIKILFPTYYKRSLARVSTAPIYGYRIKIYDLIMFHNHTFQESIEFMRNEFNNGNKIIFLNRENKFRQAMSSLVAEARGTYHQKKGANGLAEKVVVDAKSIPERIEKLKQFSSWEKEALAGFDYLEINYEKDLLPPDRHQATLDRITEFLGVEACAADSQYKRSSDDDISKYVENHEEVLSILRSSGNEFYLNSKK